MTPRAEIITIGDEILIGQIVDTNSAWIGQQFANCGVRVHQITSVSDSSDHIQEAVRLAAQRADIIVITGGLGPTKDDITKQALASLMGVKLVRDQATFAHVERMMNGRGIDFNASNQSQALVLDGCRVLLNNNGTAPGMCFEYEGKLTFSLPGVPFEMKALVQEAVIPEISRKFQIRPALHKTITLFGIAESELSELIEAWEVALPEYLHLAYLPNPRALRLRLSLYDGREGGLNEIEQQFLKLQTLIKPYYLGPEPASVESSLARLLTESGQTLAVAESCTGGAISARITAMEGASAFYMGGICSYSNDVKMNTLGVRADTISDNGAVSSQVAQAMAIGARKALGTDFAIATTGIAGPTGGTPQKPVGTVWIAIAWQGGAESRLLQLGKLREPNIERASTQALNLLRQHLLSL